MSPVILAAIIDLLVPANRQGQFLRAHRRSIRLGLAGATLLFLLSCLVITSVTPFILSHLLNRVCTPLFIH